MFSIYSIIALLNIDYIGPVESRTIFQVISSHFFLVNRFVGGLGPSFAAGLGPDPDTTSERAYDIGTFAYWQTNGRRSRNVCVIPLISIALQLSI